MEELPPVSDRRIFGIMGIVIAVLVVATLAAIGAVVLMRQGGSGAPATPPAAGASTQTTLRTAVDLRSAPAADTAIVTRLLAGTPVRVLGRSPDANWLVVGLTGASDLVGWVPVAAVAGVANAQGLVVVADARSLARGAASATFTPDLPDLRVERALAQQNRLVVVIVNDGPGDLTTPVLVAVNDAAPVRIETKSGEPLRARDRLETIVPGAYVQLRAPVAVRVLTQPEGAEEDTTNNSWSGIIEPDVPNDLEILRATVAGSDRHLVVTVRNGSPIPILGSVTLTVREAPPSTTLLGRDTRDVALDPGATLDVPFADVRGVDVTRITVRLSTDAISDAVLANDSFPR